ncbi:MAG: pitrilysin family protein [Pseudomonadota bacterium]
MTVQETRLENGIRVLTELRPTLQTAALGIWVGAGARNEAPGEHGISHLLEHMAFKGTGKRSAREIAETIEAVGGDLNAATSYETTAYYARVLGEDVPLGLDILCDILTDSRFDADELKSEQHVIVQEIGAVMDTPEDLVHDLFQEAAFPGQPIGRSILGTPDSVTGFSRTDLSTYLDSHYVGPDMVVAGVGAVEHEQIVATVNRLLASIPTERGPQPEPASFRGGEARETRDLEQAQIVFGLEGPPIGHDEFYVARLAAGVLGGGMSSRLFQEVREKRGLCYSIYAFMYAFRDTGLVGVSAATNGNDVEALIDTTFTELRKAAKTITDDELSRSKAQLKVGILMSQESSASRAEQIARQTLALNRIVPAEEIVSRIEAVTRDDLIAFLEQLYTRPAAVSAVGPIEGLESVTGLQERLRLS